MAAPEEEVRESDIKFSELLRAMRAVCARDDEEEPEEEAEEEPEEEPEAAAPTRADDVIDLMTSAFAAAKEIEPARKKKVGKAGGGETGMAGLRFKKDDRVECRMKPEAELDAGESPYVAGVVVQIGYTEQTMSEDEVAPYKVLLDAPYNIHVYVPNDDTYYVRAADRSPMSDLCGAAGRR